jgi:hypothetical protein
MKYPDRITQPQNRGSRAPNSCEPVYYCQSTLHQRKQKQTTKKAMNPETENTLNTEL